ncbi:MAG: nicotinic acid mononucleotide adenyltransferase [Bacteroidetes bacterium]|nr:nicotinic acid mononucleotide adenyltransferase [Bacteroidota bacterium]MDA1318468.1 nicotinic acid mononucleotide adenyltransferase [Bacteroidota bacterium]
MKTLKPYFLPFLYLFIFWSCERDELRVPENNNNTISLEQLLRTYELWYVDINSTSGNGQTAFVEMAFTLSFLNGNLYANNNLVGFGEQGNGYGIYVGEYETGGIILDIYHDIDGHQRFEVYQESASSIELYNPSNNTSYFLDGYQRNEFDYDGVFFENVDYFLQEYKSWEKTLTSAEGNETNFDSENYLYFFYENNNNLFKSSEDEEVGNVDNIYWDYTGNYTVESISGGGDIKNLTLDYDFYGDDYFELSVINDELIRLFHSDSGKTYEFRGVNNIVFMRTQENGKSDKSSMKVRPQKTIRKENLRTKKLSNTATYFAKL